MTVDVESSLQLNYPQDSTTEVGSKQTADFQGSEIIYSKFGFAVERDLDDRPALEGESERK